MFSIQGLGRHKLFCTGLKLCPVCKTMIKILDFETHLERCKNANASPSLTGSPIQTHRILKNIAAKTKPRTSQVRVNHSHTSAVSEENASSSPSPLEILRDQYKQLFQKKPPRKFRLNEKWLRQKINSLPSGKFVQGESVYVLASSFGTEWAKQEFGSNWRSAKCRGKLGKYNTKSKMWEVRYANDRNVYFFKEKDLIPFTE